MLPTAYNVVFSTAPSLRLARNMARQLLDRKLCACINLCPVESHYVWKGKKMKDRETLLIIKTRRDKVRDLLKTLSSLHPYDVPEIVTLPLQGGAKSYLRWIDTVLQA